MLLSIPVTVALNPGLATDLFDLNFKIIVFAWKCERSNVVKKNIVFCFIHVTFDVSLKSEGILDPQR